VAVYVAFGILIGYSAAQAQHPDLDDLLRIIGKVAAGEFARQRKN
jgi:hypothetical protein